MNIVTVTDAWRPQVNGVVNTIVRTNEQLVKLGHTVHVISPQDFRTVPLPTYPEIRLALFPGRRVRAMLDALNPDAVHIATEGTLGLAARAWCLKNRFPFTTAFHTQFPEYVWLRARIPLALSYRLMRWFHGPASTLMVATPTLHQRLRQRGFRNLGYWSRGVDTRLFRPRIKSYLDANRPIFLYMGRVAIEKNIEAFLRLDLPGTKYVVGSGPDLETLRRRYPAVRFTGFKSDEDLAKHLAAADVFVFPSRTDTFGMVMIEALACGVPVAAYPVQGPADVIENGITGCLNNDLREAALAALKLDPQGCRVAALQYTWETCTRQFLGHLEAARQGAAAAFAAGRPAG
jgi:1,2-diacylglycerol 3-alpha-glucosyltransferase/glucuronosyltransferase